MTSFFNAQQQNEQVQIEPELQFTDQSQDKSVLDAVEDANQTKLEEKEAEGENDKQKVIDIHNLSSNALEPPAEKRSVNFNYIN